MEEQPGSLLQFSNRQRRVRRVVAGACRSIESAASGDEGDRPASAELTNAADLPTTEELASEAAAVPPPLAWTNRKLIDEVPLENMLNVLIETFLLQGIAHGVIEVRRELGLRLFGVREGFAPGVVDLVVPATGEAPSDFRLQPVVVGPTTAADVVRHKRVTVDGQEEARAGPANTSLDTRLGRVEEGVALRHVVGNELTDLVLTNQIKNRSVGKVSAIPEPRDDRKLLASGNSRVKCRARAFVERRSRPGYCRSLKLAISPGSQEVSQEAILENDHLVSIETARQLHAAVADITN